ncbi:hypothetical protein JTE90_001713 [Oedothorax gibbosus]|uniref:DNA transposase THAP9 n=1 Tax=Oedothorax gibbosus TaxID=931172 RepID=A0AAV6TTD4_9ARAC|nr:hypothetical protein JTE90_001713 [Oedothorax gibbosus]
MSEKSFWTFIPQVKSPRRPIHRHNTDKPHSVQEEVVEEEDAEKGDADNAVEENSDGADNVVEEKRDGADNEVEEIGDSEKRDGADNEVEEIGDSEKGDGNKVEDCNALDKNSELLYVHQHVETANLVRKLDMYEAKAEQYKKKIKLLNQNNRRYKKKNLNLKSILKECVSKGFFNEDSLQILYKAAGPHTDFIDRQLCRANESYSPELRKFALTLHFYSPRAYKYVREAFNFCLPHPRTISRWYQHVEVEPGFTSEAMKALTRKVESSKWPLFFALTFDEMAIRQHIEFDGKKFHGYVDVGLDIEDDALPIAKEALVFMVVCINAQFKIPVGYFLCNGLNGEQKANLLKQCLILLHEHKVDIVSCTFDGLSI